MTSKKTAFHFGTCCASTFLFLSWFEFIDGGHHKRDFKTNSPFRTKPIF